ncbi:Uncharacterised protein [Serratia rubidaea]|uniref:Uncharacterized protein n=1 Tax=Serratia rubidaea TaxID=61652 RepID=A0A4U9HDB0_SERRU|nr:Uncharacterised protein [Serratia rubidaea]
MVPPKAGIAATMLKNVRFLMVLLLAWTGELDMEVLKGFPAINVISGSGR